MIVLALLSLERLLKSTNKLAICLVFVLVKQLGSVTRRKQLLVSLWELETMLGLLIHELMVFVLTSLSRKEH